MKITKYLHSCLVIEEHDATILIDPGVFTYQERALSIHSLTKLDYLLVTHEHADHLFIPFVLELVKKFPDLKIITNPAVAEIIKKEHIDASITETESIIMQEFQHEKLWDGVAPQNTLFHIYNKFTHPGDSLHFDKTNDVLALPITAPWGSTTEAINKALEVKPKVIIPIHDWMWKDEIRKGMYTRLEKFFAEHNIQFKGVETGETVEI